MYKTALIEAVVQKKGKSQTDAKKRWKRSKNTLQKH